MKKSISLRILTALSSLVLLAVAAGTALEGFGGYPVTETLGQLLTSQAPLAVLCKIVSVLVLIVLACAAFVCALPARKQKASEYVMQKGDNGPIGISIRAIEKLVRTCIAKHEVLADADVSVREAKDGVVILLNVDEVSGVSIPLTVDMLQRQIRQYVTGCTGIAVSEVRVMVETRTEQKVQSVFEVRDDVFPPAVIPTEDFRAEPQSQPQPAPRQEELQPVPEKPVQPKDAYEQLNAEPELAAEDAAEVEIPEELPEAVLPVETEPVDDRPLHQRVFGTEEQPVTVPVPPEMAAEPAVQPEAEEQPMPEEEAQTKAHVEAEEAPAEAVDEDWQDPDFQEAANAFLNDAVPNATDDGSEAEESDEAPEEVGGEANDVPQPMI